MNPKNAKQEDARQRVRLARTHLRGVVCARDECYEEAEESCLSAIELDPKEVGPYVTLTSVYACARQYGKMVGVLRKAVGVDAVALRASLDDEPQGNDRSTGGLEEGLTSRRGLRGSRGYRTHSSVW